jgi:chemotaxis protein MotA
MKFLGVILVFACTFGGYTLLGGHMSILLKAMPFEGMIIVGSGIGAFITANTSHTIKGALKGFKAYIKPETYDKNSYIELLSMLYLSFKLARTKGWLAMEQHIENPEDSELFRQFEGFFNNHHAITFFCDYLRIISLGNEDPHEIGDLMDQEIETLTEEKMHPAHAVQVMADGLPALGIVAAVLGVIKTMGAITEPPEVLGKMIGSALVGTFLGVWVSYGFAAPAAGAIGAKAESEILYYKCMKVGIIAFLGGAAPQVAVEFARKFLPHHVQPSFTELEEVLNDLPSAT